MPKLKLTIMISDVFKRILQENASVQKGLDVTINLDKAQIYGVKNEASEFEAYLIKKASTKADCYYKVSVLNDRYTLNELDFDQFLSEYSRVADRVEKVEELNPLKINLVDIKIKSNSALAPQIRANFTEKATINLQKDFIAVKLNTKATYFKAYNLMGELVFADYLLNTENTNLRSYESIEYVIEYGDQYLTKCDVDTVREQWEKFIKENDSFLYTIGNMDFKKVILTKTDVSYALGNYEKIE